MKIAREQINPYVQAVEEAQGDIRTLVQQGFIKRLTQGEVNRRLKSIIDKATNGIKIERLKADARRSLLNFANRQRQVWQSMRLSPEALLFLGNAVGSGVNIPPALPDSVSAEIVSAGYETNSKGVPLGRYYQDIWNDLIQPTMDKLARGAALDPNDYTGRNSLRNLAEMEVRYHDHQDTVDNLRSGGVKLVVCSSHADCSDRCARWQGRIYSLDGTSGRIDGHSYVPLETATDMWYTTKAGRRYKNGLLGFNCRHQIEPYKGKLLPQVSAEKRRKEYAITQRQRELERAVRRAKSYALNNKGVNTKLYKSYTNKAKKLYNEYVQFCADNNRAYYPMRVRI